MNKIRVAFLGNSQISVSALKALKNDQIEIVLVISGMDKPIGRNHSKLVPNPVVEYSKLNNLNLVQTDNINKDFEKIKDFEIDYIVTCSFGQFLGEKVLKWPKILPLNIHTSLLPKGRGGAPIHWAIILGETETGYSLMEMIKEMDAGQVYFQRKVSIEANETLDQLYEDLSNQIEKHFLEDFLEHVVKNPNPKKQNEEEVTLWFNIKPEDRLINWNEKTSKQIINQINGLNSKPMAITSYNDLEIKIISAKLNDLTFPMLRKMFRPGEIIILLDEYIAVKTIDGIILIESFVIPGKKPTNFKNFKNGNSHFFQIGKKFTYILKEDRNKTNEIH